MSNNQCPLCSTYGSMTKVDFQFDGIRYHGIACTRCKSMLHSYEEKEEEKIRGYVERYLELSGVKEQ